MVQLNQKYIISNNISILGGGEAGAVSIFRWGRCGMQKAAVYLYAHSGNDEDDNDGDEDAEKDVVLDDDDDDDDDDDQRSFGYIFSQKSTLIYPWISPNFGNEI